MMPARACPLRRTLRSRRQVDVGMLLALLAAVSRASCEERLAAAYKLLLQQAGAHLLPRPLAVAYVRLLKVCTPSTPGEEDELALDACTQRRAGHGCLEPAPLVCSFMPAVMARDDGQYAHFLTSAACADVSPQIMLTAAVEGRCWDNLQYCTGLSQHIRLTDAATY